MHVAILVAICLNFALIHVMPGSPARRFYADPRVPPEVKEEIIRSFGFDRPLWEQFFLYLRNVSRGNLGISYTFQRPVLQLILARIPWTLAITVIPTFFSILAGLYIGLIAAWRRGGILDQLLRSLGVAVTSIPSFWFAMLLVMVLAFWGGFFPPPGDGKARTFLLRCPISIYEKRSLPCFPPYAHLVYSGCSWICAGDEGCCHQHLGRILHHGGKGKGSVGDEGVAQTCAEECHPTVDQYAFLDHCRNYRGALLVEQVFSWYGMGLLLIRAANARDFPLVQAAALITIIMTITANFFADVLQAHIDPRIRYG